MLFSYITIGMRAWVNIYLLYKTLYVIAYPCSILGPYLIKRKSPIQICSLTVVAPYVLNNSRHSLWKSLKYGTGDIGKTPPPGTPLLTHINPNSEQQIDVQFES